MNLKELYQEIILDHGKNPRNLGKFENFNKDAKENIEKFLDMIKEKDNIDTKLLEEDEKTKLMSLGGVKNYPMRVKCATLSWHALSSALEDFQKEVTTE